LVLFGSLGSAMTFTTPSARVASLAWEIQRMLSPERDLSGSV